MFVYGNAPFRCPCWSCLATFAVDAGENSHAQHVALEIHNGAHARANIWLDTMDSIEQLAQ